MCLYKTHAAIHWIVGILLHVSHIIYTDNENFLKTNLQIHWITVLEKYNPLKQIHEEGDLIGSIGIKQLKYQFKISPNATLGIICLCQWILPQFLRNSWLKQRGNHLSHLWNLHYLYIRTLRVEHRICILSIDPLRSIQKCKK